MRLPWLEAPDSLPHPYAIDAIRFTPGSKTDASLKSLLRIWQSDTASETVHRAAGETIWDLFPEAAAENKIPKPSGL